MPVGDPDTWRYPGEDYDNDWAKVMLMDDHPYLEDDDDNRYLKINLRKRNGFRSGPIYVRSAGWRSFVDYWGVPWPYNEVPAPGIRMSRLWMRAVRAVIHELEIPYLKRVWVLLRTFLPREVVSLIQYRPKLPVL